MSNEREQQNLEHIQRRLEHEYKNYSHYITGDLETAQRLIDRIAKQVSKILAEKLVVELTPNNAVKFTMVLPNGKKLLITKRLSSADGDSVIFSIFEKTDLLIADTIDINTLSYGINKYIQMA